MKTLFFIGAFLLLQLTAVDTLLQTRPDSALALLLDEPLDEPYYQLLLSEALYKNDYAQANRHELLKALDYFDSIQDPFLSARCHYMNGISYYEMDSIVPACAEYMKALEIMETHFKEKDLVGDKARFMALTYTHLCQLFSDQYFNEQAIYFGKCALPYYNKYDAEPWHVAWILEVIGANFNMLEKIDSADFYYEKAAMSLTDSTVLTYRDIEAHRACLYYKKSGNSEIALNRLYRMLLRSEGEAEHYSRCMVIGEIYYQTGCWDSAYYYLNRVYNGVDDTDAKVLSAQYLHDICLKTGDSLAQDTYTLFLSKQARTSDSQSVLHSQLATLYLDYEMDNEVFIHKQQRSRLMFFGGFIIISLVVITVLFAVIFKKRLKKEVRSHQIQQKALKGRLKNSNKALMEASQQIENLKTNQQEFLNNPEIIDFEAFKDCPICRHILDLVENLNFKSKTDFSIYKTIALDRKQLHSLVDSADLFLVRFSVRLRKKFPSLTKDDMYYCCLYLIGLNEADISALMQRAYSTVCERNRKIKRVLSVQGDLSAALQDLVYNM